MRGTAELHVDWGGYRVSVGLTIDPDEAHRSNHVVTVDMPLPTWGETKLTFNKATRPLGVIKDTGEKPKLGPRDPERSQGQAMTNSSLRPKSQA